MKKQDKEQIYRVIFSTLEQQMSLFQEDQLIEDINYYLSKEKNFISFGDIKVLMNVDDTDVPPYKEVELFLLKGTKTPNYIKKYKDNSILKKYPFFENTKADFFPHVPIELIVQWISEEGDGKFKAKKLSK